MIKKYLLLFLVIMNICTVGVYAQNASGKMQYQIFDENFCNGTYDWEGDIILNGWDGELIPPVGTRYCLSFVSYQDKTAVLDYAEAASTKGVMPCVDTENSALQFWFYPYVQRNEWYIGLTCWGLDTDSSTYIKGISAIYVNLADYTDLSKINEWQLVTIPLKDIKEKGVFDKYIDTKMTSFDWYRICGFYTRVSTEGYEPGGLYNLAAYDEIKLISYLWEPQNTEISQSGENALITWDEQYDAAGYIVYKNDSEVARLPKNNPYYECELGSYSIQSYNDSGEYSNKVYASTDILNCPSDGTNIMNIDNVKYNIEDGNSIIFWDKADGAQCYYVYRDNELVGKTTAESYTDKNIGKTYTVRAYKDASLSDFFEANRISEKNATEVSYIGFDGNLYQSISDADRIKKIVVTANNYGVSKDAVIALAVYENGRLTDIKTVNGYVKSGRTEHIISKELFAKDMSNCIVKAFLLDNSSVKPLMDNAVKNESINQKEKYSINIQPQSYQTINGWGIEPALPGQMVDDRLNKWEPYKKALFEDLGITMTRAFLDCELYVNGIINDSAVPGSELGSIMQQNIINNRPFDGSLYKENIILAEDIENAVRNKDFDRVRVQNTANLIKLSVDNNIDKYLISITSPPRVMLDCYDPGGGNNPRYHIREDCIEAFTDLIIDELDYITKDFGQPKPYALSIQNEPENGLYTPQYAYDEYKNTVISLREKLDSHGYENVKLVGPESSHYGALWVTTGEYDNEKNMYKAFTKMDSELSDALDVMACHSYFMPEWNADGSVNMEETDRRFNEYADYEYKEKWQTEFCPGNSVERGKSYDMRTANEVIQILCSDVGWAGNNVWFYWLGFYGMYVPLEDSCVEVSWGPNSDGGLGPNTQTLGYGAPGMDNFYKNKVYDALSMVFKNVTPGYIVKRVDTNCTEIKNEKSSITNIAAFEKDNSTCVLLVNNTENNYSFDFNYLNGNTGTVYAVMDDVPGISKIGNVNVENGMAANVAIPKNSIVLLKTEQKD